MCGVFDATHRCERAHMYGFERNEKSRDGATTRPTTVALRDRVIDTRSSHGASKRWDGAPGAGLSLCPYHQRVTCMYVQLQWWPFCSDKSTTCGWWYHTVHTPYVRAQNGMSRITGLHKCYRPVDPVLISRGVTSVCILHEATRRTLDRHVSIGWTAFKIEYQVSTCSAELHIITQPYFFTLTNIIISWNLRYS